MDQDRPKESTNVTNVHGWVKSSLWRSETGGIAIKRLEGLPPLRSTPSDRRTFFGKLLDCP